MLRMWKVEVEYECPSGATYILHGELLAINEDDALRQAEMRVPAECRVTGYNFEPLGVLRSIAAALKNIFW